MLRGYLCCSHSVRILIPGILCRFCVQIASNVTSFGVGLSVKDPSPEATASGGVERNKAAGVSGGEESWKQIPLAYPLCTGLFAQDAAGDDIDVMKLMQHAGRLLQFDFKSLNLLIII